jgi:hypothetical protein
MFFNNNILTIHLFAHFSFVRIAVRTEQTVLLVLPPFTLAPLPLLCFRSPRSMLVQRSSSAPQVVLLNALPVHVATIHFSGLVCATRTQANESLHILSNCEGNYDRNLFPSNNSESTIAATTKRSNETMTPK